MGNNASSPKTPGTPGHEGSSTTGSANTGGRPVHYHQQLQQQQQQQQQQKGARNPVLVPSQRSAAPPEPSMAHAQGSTASSASRSIPSRPYSTTAAEAAAAASASPSRAPSKPRNTPPPPTKPVDVPQPSAAVGTAKIPIAPPANVVVPSATGGIQVPAGFSDFEPPLSPYADSMDVPVLTHNSVPDVSYLTRPPRLPLPIEEEVHTPGSPIIAPRKDGDPVDDIEALDNDGLTHRSSTLSSVTVEEEDMEELRVDKTRPTVPTRLEWLRGGEKVYVTGTIFQWNKKQRMHPVEGRPGVFATTINVLPGTHHIRFLVDNQMETSRDLPTTVDFGNNLVNYIEVASPSASPKHHPPAASTTTATGAPVSSPGAAATAPAAAGSNRGPAVSKQQQPQSGQQEAQAPRKLSGAETRAGASLIGADSSVQLTDRAPKWKNVPEPSAFSHELPKFLVDYDQPDDSPDFHTAAAATEILPMPPSLPGFLGKPILNAATLIKDDNSVLNMPNYTILNHLATSSIKNNILAVSATTRYKDKFTTIIIYKPTGGDDVKR
ncbi:galactose metabolism-related protein [Sporothrix curviconia]|uniref:Galactose metabolism-related protein n=1 Tax=Sporothrix curviconia TaxID=1260050 RepID=A0ABP0AKE6_9PEZI